MYNNYNYPPGADTPDAPWNREEPQEIYGDEVNRIIDEEMEEGSDGIFAEWLMENGYLPDERDVSEDTLEQLVSILADDKMVGKAYYSHRRDAVLEECMAVEPVDDDPDQDI